MPGTRHSPPDVEGHAAGLFLYPPGVFRGRDGLRAGLRQQVEHAGGTPRVTLREVAERGSHVLVIGAVSVPASRRPVTLPASWIVETAEGRIARVRGFTNESLARTEWARVIRAHPSNAG